MVPLAPWLAKYIPEAEKIKMSCEIIHGCKIVDAAGKVLTEIPKGQGDAYTHAEITLPDLRPAPSEDQLPSRLPFFSYFSSDYLLPWWTIPVYRQGLRQAWGII